MSAERAFEGVWIPAELWLDDSLTLQEKVMLVEVKSLSVDPERGCYKSNRGFAKFFGVSVSRISQILSSLEEKGCICIQQKRDGKQVLERNIFLSDTYLEKLTPSLGKLKNPVRKPKEGYLGNAKESNTLLSNTLENNNTGTSPEVDPVKTEFEQLWKTYPKRAGGNPKGEALKAYRKQRKTHPFEEFQSGLQRYLAYCDHTQKTATEFVMQTKRFLGPGKHWQEAYHLPLDSQQGLGLPKFKTAAQQRSERAAATYDYDRATNF